MKKSHFTCFFLLLLMLFLAACTPVDLRSQTSTSLQIEFDGKNCLPLESIVPPREDIQVQISNSGQIGITWIIAIPPFNPSLPTNESTSIIFSKFIASGTTETTQFKSPALPARYDTFCILENPEQAVMLQYLLVVRPDD